MSSAVHQSWNHRLPAASAPRSAHSDSQRRDCIERRRVMNRGRRLVVALAALGLIVISLIVIGRIGRGRSSRSPRTLEIDMEASAGTFAQLFWADGPSF